MIPTQTIHGIGLENHQDGHLWVFANPEILVFLMLTFHKCECHSFWVLGIRKA